MPSKITLTLGTALAGIALCCFVESSFAQDALVASLDATENDDRDAEDKDDKDEKSGRRQTRTTNSLSSRFLTRSGDNMSLGLTSVGALARSALNFTAQYRKPTGLSPTANLCQPALVQS